MMAEWKSYPALSGTAEIKEGVFVEPDKHTYINKKKQEKKVYFNTDCAYLKEDSSKRAILRTEMLSRDVCTLPDDFENPILESSYVEGLPEGSNGLWFHISMIDLKKSLQDQYKKLLAEHDKRLPKIGKLGASETFRDEYSRAYQHRIDKPKIRYHCNINSLLESYRQQVIKHPNINEVDFCIFGSIRYTLEMMYTILICPRNCEELDKQRFPVMEIGKFYDTVRIIKDDADGREEGAVGGILNDRNRSTADYSDRYFIEWKPHSTRIQANYMWDHVTFLFYIPTGSDSTSLKLIKPYKYQSFGIMKEVQGTSTETQLSALIGELNLGDKK